MPNAIIAALPIPHFWPFSFFHKSPLDGVKNLNDLKELITTHKYTVDELIKWKDSIKSYIHTRHFNEQELNRFLLDVTIWSISQDPQKVFKFLGGILDLETLNNIARLKVAEQGMQFDSAIGWAKQRAEIYPKQVADRTHGASKEWRRYQPVFLYFIPNIINLFLDTFNLLDAHRKFTSLWDKYLLVEIVCKFFLIPYALVQLLQPFLIVTAKVYVAAALIIVGTGLLIAAYKRWLKPIPNEVINCTNTSKQVDLGLVDPKIGEAEELSFIAPLLNGSNVLLIAKSGEGKTSQVHRFIQLQKEKKVSKELQNLHVFSMDCGALINNGTFGHFEMLSQTKDDIEGFEKKILIFFDEIDQLISTPASFQALKKRFLEDSPCPRFIAATTFEGYKKIQEIDIDGSFRRRVVPIIIENTPPDQSRLMLYELIQRTAKDLPITEDAIDKTIALANTYLEQIGKPAKIIKIMNDAIGRCRWAYDACYTNPKLGETKLKYQALAKQIACGLNEKPETLQKIKELREKITKLERKQDQYKAKAKKIKENLQKQLHFKDDYFKLTHRLAEVPNNRASKEMQKLYLLYSLYGLEAFKTVLDQDFSQIRAKMDVQIDSRLIEEVVAESKRIEENLHAQQA